MRGNWELLFLLSSILVCRAFVCKMKLAAAAGAKLRIRRYHGVTPGAASVPPLIPVEQRLAGELLTAIGTVRSAATHQLTAGLAHFGLFHYVGAKPKVLQLVEFRLFCHLTILPSLHTAAVSCIRGKTARKNEVSHRSFCSIAVHTQREHTPHIPEPRDYTSHPTPTCRTFYSG